MGVQDRAIGDECVQKRAAIERVRREESPATLLPGLNTLAGFRFELRPFDVDFVDQGKSLQPFVLSVFLFAGAWSVWKLVRGLEDRVAGTYLTRQ